MWLKLVKNSNKNVNVIVNALQITLKQDLKRFASIKKSNLHLYGELRDSKFNIELLTSSVCRTLNVGKYRETYFCEHCEQVNL